ncbi:MAG: hypothetical protein ACOH19_06090 [Rhodoglobus sp.]
MSDDASKFDPRFDPAFQRGYDGPVRPSVRRRPRADSPPEPIGLPPQYSAVERPVLADPMSDLLRREDAGRTERRAPRESTDYDDEEIAPRGRNPFLIILAMIGVLLILGSVALLMNLDQILERANQNSSQSYYNLTLVIQLGTPMLITLGLTTLIGVLFVFAVRWKR